LPRGREAVPAEERRVDGYPGLEGKALVFAPLKQRECGEVAQIAANDVLDKVRPRRGDPSEAVAPFLPSPLPDRVVVRRERRLVVHGFYEQGRDASSCDASLTLAASRPSAAVHGPGPLILVSVQ
jgi:hypothetical protein